jgi:hypothetical protein
MLMSQFASRLLDLKSAKPDGKPAFSKRIQFQIQNLQDLRSNGWQRKLFNLQAKKKSDIRNDAMKDQKTKGTDVVFMTQTAGLRPAYIDDLKIAKPGRSQPKAEVSTKVEWSQSHVKKCFFYYVEEKNGQQLQEDWAKAQPTTAQAKQGIEWLCEVGFHDVQKEEIAADTIVELLQRQVINWSTLIEAVGPSLEGLEDLKIDDPRADLFLHSLFAKLMVVNKELPFNPAILKHLPMATEKAQALTWSVMCGAFKKVKKVGGEAYKRALDIPEMQSFLIKAKGCEPGNIRRALQDDTY